MRRGEVWINTTAAFGLAGAGLLGPAWASDPAPPPAPAASVELPAGPALPQEKAAWRRARPPLLPAPRPAPLPWERHLEIGADFAMVIRPGGSDILGQPTPVRLLPAPAWGIHLTWEVLRYLHFGGYFIGVGHGLSMPRGSFGQPGTIHADEPVHTYVFGARAAATYPFTDRLRMWLSAGAGWGRITYPRLQVTEAGHAPYALHERDAFIVELPVGLGVAYAIIPRWLNLELSTSFAFLPSQQGPALQEGQAVDYTGVKRTIGGVPRLDGSIVQTIGFALIL